MMYADCFFNLISQLKFLVVYSFYFQGQRERDQCYKPILEELDSLFPDRSKERYTVLLLFVFDFWVSDLSSMHYEFVENVVFS